jgi:epoxyqueuosine reductase
MSFSATKAAVLTRHIREEARRLGFFKTGITPVRPLPWEDKFNSWLEQGRHGEMKYLAKQASRRRDPGLVLQNARSLVIVAANYFSPDPISDEPLGGRISRYAWGEDYHLLMGQRLMALQESILRADPGARTLSYVDTGPVMEKVWGAHSALGWMGKHTNLITREQGSWFFIGVVLLDVDLEFDQPEKDHCGTCSRCIPACPTGAIVAPYVVDARLCISYLTIELRGTIPRHLRPLIGNRIFGCDDCQEVCPWNRFAVKTPERRFGPRSLNLMPELSSLADITPEEFSQRYQNSPIRRAKRDGFVRNVMVALGNSGSPDALPGLVRGIHDQSPLVRAHAAWALRRIPGDAARIMLEQARATEADPCVMEELPG